MLLSSTSTLDNKTIIKYHGLVHGESLIGSNIYKDLFSGVRDVVAGRTSTYEEDLDGARNEAIEAIEAKAKEYGANGIIGLKISYNNLGGTMGNTILVSVYGTAVTYKD
ncbi:YbjQ family protein [uncultured Methanobrevibacter sp.]|uniref:YbjQ family protein n=1 Tax=uncultured Methanobrevibacter sp. TaxID=253161 RepID=UPI0025FD1977|nr:YbjQ family protein [uncultured Methanobrevibacter sp.]